MSSVALADPDADDREPNRGTGLSAFECRTAAMVSSEKKANLEANIIPMPLGPSIKDKFQYRNDKQVRIRSVSLPDDRSGVLKGVSHRLIRTRH